MKNRGNLTNIEELKACYRVHIIYKDEFQDKKIYSRTFNFRKCGGKENALRLAQEDRDKVKDQLKGNTSSIWTVNSVYKKSMQYIATTIRTQERHDRFYDKCISEKFGTRDLHTITTADIQASLVKFAEVKSDDTLKRIVSVWKRIYKTAAILDLGITDKTVGLVIPRSKVPARAKRKPLTVETYAKACLAILPETKKIDNPIWADYVYDRYCIYYMIRLMYMTGMRPAEVLALEKGDFDESCIHIYKAVGSTSKKTVQIVPTKTVQSVRDFPMAARLKELCNEILHWSKHNYIFSRYDGSLWDTDRLSDIITHAMKKAGIDFRLYDLRHDFASRMLKTTSPAVVRDLMGHANFDMSIAYGRTSESDMMQALQSDENSTAELSEPINSKSVK